METKIIVQEEKEGKYDRWFETIGEYVITDYKVIRENIEGIVIEFSRPEDGQITRAFKDARDRSERKNFFVERRYLDE
jgi:hypothetical protein